MGETCGKVRDFAEKCEILWKTGKSTGFCRKVLDFEEKCVVLPGKSEGFVERCRILHGTAENCDVAEKCGILRGAVLKTYCH